MEAVIVLKKYKDIEVAKKQVKVTNDEIDQRIQKELFNLSELCPSTHHCINVGDIAVFDFAGEIDSKAFQGGSAENYTLQIGSKMFIPGFEEQMIGMKKGEEKVITVTFPTNYQASDLAGKNCNFTIKVHEIKERVVPELCDETAKKFKLENVNTVNELRNYICDLIYAEKEKFANNQAIDSLYHILFNENEYDIPEEMVKEKLEREVEKAKAQAEAYGISFEEFLAYQGLSDVDAFKALLKNGIENLMKRDLLLNAVAKQENIEITDEEFESYYQMLAENEKQSMENIKKKYSKDFLQSKIILFKAEDFLVSSAKFKTVE